MSSEWRKYLTEPGNIRVVAIDMADLTRGLCIQQGLSGNAQRGYAEALVASLLIASSHKSNEAINMNAQGSGIYRQAIIDASPEGRVRGFLIEQKDVDQISYGPDGKAGPWGTGVLSILYTKNFMGKAPYTGMVPIASGYLDEAVNEYYRDSEQLVSLIGVNVELGPDGRVAIARGVLAQALGGAEPDELERLKNLNVSVMRALAKVTDQAQVFETQAKELLQAKALTCVERIQLEAFCNCSQERIERALLLTGESDILEALGDDEIMTITCDFCRTEYKLSAERVRALFKPDPSRLQ